VRFKVIWISRVNHMRLADRKIGRRPCVCFHFCYLFRIRIYDVLYYKYKCHFILYFDVLI
jgi:hypothetical protein